MKFTFKLAAAALCIATLNACVDRHHGSPHDHPQGNQNDRYYKDRYGDRNHNERRAERHSNAKASNTVIGTAAGYALDDNMQPSLGGIFGSQVK